jgi:hypothetical protein
MDPIYVQPDKNDEKYGRLKTDANRRTYAVAPCHHLFVCNKFDPLILVADEFT